MERRLAAVMVSDMYSFSRLMEQDEDGIITRQKTHRQELIDPEIARNHGRIVKSTGDGLLAEFPAADDALRCALEIQKRMVERETGSTEDQRIQFRVGINVGDVVIDDGDIFGDGVNVAARLQTLAEPGGVAVSDIVHQIAHGLLDEPFIDLGSQKVKNISRAIRVWQWTPDTRPAPETPALAQSQRVQFCTAQDGAQLAWSRIGEGPPLLKAPNWFNHLEYEWRSPLWGPWLVEMAKRCSLVRFDQRGNGLSDWEVEDISLDAMHNDISAVADAASLDSFGLVAMSQGCAFSVRYAAEFPERVRYLILYGGYLRGGRQRSAQQTALMDAFVTMIREGWGSPSPRYRRIFTDLFLPDATQQQQESLDELLRVSASPDNAERIFEMNNGLNYLDYAKKVDAPTLVLHCEGDERIPLAEGRLLAASLPNARFVALPGSNHVLLDGSPAFDRLLEETDRFMQEVEAG